MVEFHGGEQRAGQQRPAYLLLPGPVPGVPLRRGGHVIHYKGSGLGREFGSAGLSHYAELKSTGLEGSGLPA